MKNATHSDLSNTAAKLTFSGKLKGEDLKEARRLKDLRTFTRRDKTSLSFLVSRYL
jgi:hypothetical protein